MSSDKHTGYFRTPTISTSDRDWQVVFVSEDDLWTVTFPRPSAASPSPPLATRPIARRLTSGMGRVSTPHLSPSGKQIAFTSTEEGHREVFLMSASGGEAERLTYLGADCNVVGWSSEFEVLIASNYRQAFARVTEIYRLSLKTCALTREGVGPCNWLAASSASVAASEVGSSASLGSVASGGRLRRAIARHGSDAAHWKRYRGGNAGQIWIEKKAGEFEKLIGIGGNLSRPCWIGGRVFFLSDHEGIGNIYSVDDKGGDLKRHSEQKEFFARGLSSDGQCLVFHAGGSLYVLDPKTNHVISIDFDYWSPRAQIQRRYASALRYLEDFEMHPTQERAIVASRGKTFSFDLWRGPVFQHGLDGVSRFRLGRFTQDGERVVLISDAGGEESIEIHDARNRAVIQRLEGLDLGRTTMMRLSPKRDEVALLNHRRELIWVDLQSKRRVILDSSKFGSFDGFNWSQCGRWIAYNRSISSELSAIFICDTKTLECHQVTDPVLHDVRPFFDPKGEFLYFISYRELDPVYDNLHFALSFPRGSKPYLLSLCADTCSPFGSDYRPPEKEKKKKKASEDLEAAADLAAARELNSEWASELTADSIGMEKPAATADGAFDLTGDTAPGAIQGEFKIDFEGIRDRIAPFPVSDGRYGSIAANKEKVFFTRYPIVGALSEDSFSRVSAQAQLEVFNFRDEKVETVVSNIQSFRLAQDGRHLLYRTDQGLRWIKAGDRPKDSDFPNSGWPDLERVQVPVQPRDEWRQMYREAWRLQRDHFWTESMSKVDWQRVYDRYLPLLDRVATRSEVSDLLWEMQGELGTSHAYESGGDYRKHRGFAFGFLGAEFSFDEAANGYRIEKILKGDVWDDKVSSPLARLGLSLKPGDVIKAIDGQFLSRVLTPERCLVHRGDREISITFRRQGSELDQTRSIRALKSEQKLRYREWVNANRLQVRKVSGGKLGYVHIPNMGAAGFSEFYRSYLSEFDHDGLIIDVRYNGGGHVSQLLLEKLARRRIGYNSSRWAGITPYPGESPVGAMVAITNESAGSDGDIFSHSFKLLKLGPLIGTRTWGGVIGISPSHALMDGGTTTQPEYSFWFEDVGWKVENYGTEPDFEVEIRPQDAARELDPQLEKGIELCLKALQKNPPRRPQLEPGPDLSLP